MRRCSSGRRVCSMWVLALAGLCLLLIPASEARAQDSPVIDVWYGANQSFGQLGNPQPWVNILGHVSDANGISSLVYSLNGGPDVTLTVGPDGRRLQSAGDFNVDLTAADLMDGPNTVEITAVDNDSPSFQTVVTVTVDYDAAGNIWPLPYTVDWASTAAIEDAGLIVDGLWELEPGGTVRTTIPGYDRLIAMGDMAWDNYEVTVPITLHTLPSSYGAGILMRWNGHTDYPVAGWQPKSGYLPLGAICWYRAGRLEIYGNGGDILGTDTRTLSLEVPYMFKARVETIPGVGGFYSFKVWEAGQLEPLGWDVTGQEELSDPQGGSMMLISHLADVSFGTVEIDAVPVTIANIGVTLAPGGTEALVTWDTDAPASSSVAWGLTTGYESGTVSDATLKTSHGLTLTGLVPDMVYHFQITSVDDLGNPATSADRTFSTTVSDIASDDFSSPALDTNVWTFVDPLGDGSYFFTGTNTSDAWVNISVPSGTEHQVWDQGILVPHLHQSVNDADFEVEIKFESTLDQQYQEQGFFVQQDSGDYLRFEFFSTSSETKLYCASFASMVPTTLLNSTIDITGVAPLYMRVKRLGDQWTLTYSYDGASWISGATFTNGITVAGIGIYGGNAAGTGSPAHTAAIDYFFNTASPVIPEDPPLPWGISDIAVIPGPDNAIITWTTDVPANSSVAFGLTTGYELGSVSDPAYVTSHSITLTGLDPLTPHHFQVTSEDPSFNSISAPDATFSTTGQDISGIVSDDFSSGTLNTGLWTLVDPLNDLVFSMSGYGTVDAWANLTVPAAVEHQVHLGGIQAPHLLQTANDTNFEIEVKFETPVITPYQEQGILIKQDDANFLRLEFYAHSSGTMIYARGYTPASSPTFSNVNIGGTGLAPLYMKVCRIGDMWTQSYSFDGTNWTALPTFTHAMAVTGVGPYAGNGIGASAPGHTASVDYFFNTASPIIPEDDVMATASTVAANTGGVLGLSTANPCEVGIPVEIMRGGTQSLRGFTVTVDLTNLAPCNGAASIQEGTYLSNAGTTAFLVIDNQDGTYTADATILGEPCGAVDPTGVLFTVDVTHTVANGTGTINLVDLELRDCGNNPLVVAAGAPADIVIDTTPPAGVTDLAATQVMAGNPAGNVTAVDLSWVASGDATAVQTEIFRQGFGGYPEYDDNGGTAPTVPVDPAAEGWVPVAVLPAAETTFSDLPAARDFWYFCAVATDLYGNRSTSLMTGGVLNYILGDVTDGGSPAVDGDNHVQIPDVSLLGSGYGTVDGDPFYLNTLDVGPTDGMSVFGRPTTDNLIDFEDLIIFSINFDLNTSETAPAPVLATAPPSPAGRNAVELDQPGLPAVGRTFTVDMVMEGDGMIQGLRIPLQWDEKIVELIGFQAGPLLADQGGQSMVLSAEDGIVDIALVGSRDRGISGKGTVARAAFRVIGTGTPGIQAGAITARDKTNRSVAVNTDDSTGDLDENVLPRVSGLHPNYPNPFNPKTTISFDLAVRGRVRISIFSIDGRLVKTLVDEALAPGRHERVWQGRDQRGRTVASGTYIFRMEGPGVQQTRRMLLIK